EAEKWLNNDSHKYLARLAAFESIVLLKNEKNTLPFHKNIRRIAVIGEDAVEARLGGYSGPGNHKVSILDGLKQRAGDSINIVYEPGCGRRTKEWDVIATEYLSNNFNGKTSPGIRGEYFNNITLEGEPVITRVDQRLDFSWTLSSPDKSINHDFYSAKWTGKLKAPKSGTFNIGLDGNDGFRLYVNNRLLIDNWRKQTYSTRLVPFQFEKNKVYDVRVEFFEPDGNAHIKLIWNADVTDDWNAKINRAVAAAQKADVAVIVAGIAEGEFQDRAMLNLPGHQEELILKVAATHKPVVVLLVGGSAITMNRWLDKVNSVMDVWYPGEEGGRAIAHTLFGDYSPAGRLPITFPVSEAQLPLVYNHKPTGRGDDYNNLSGLPLFPFGFGLSYTPFNYSDMRIEKKNIDAKESTIVTCKIKNDGAVEGDEVVQLYIRDLLSSVARPVMELKGFQRIHLLAGEEKQISFTITPAMLSMLDKQLHSVVEPGGFRIMIGSSSRDIRLKETLTVN
ncbi:MAG: glycoside hydrolase family 3 C-terminal domain-containing protein, partial [Chitinophagales bacterium]